MVTQTTEKDPNQDLEFSSDLSNSSVSSLVFDNSLQPSGDGPKSDPNSTSSSTVSAILSDEDSIASDPVGKSDSSITSLVTVGPMVFGEVGDDNSNTPPAFDEEDEAVSMMVLESESEFNTIPQILSSKLPTFIPPPLSQMAIEATSSNTMSLISYQGGRDKQFMTDNPDSWIIRGLKSSTTREFHWYSALLKLQVERKETIERAMKPPHQLPPPVPPPPQPPPPSPPGIEEKNGETKQRLMMVYKRRVTGSLVPLIEVTEGFLECHDKKEYGLEFTYMGSRKLDQMDFAIKVMEKLSPDPDEPYSLKWVQPSTSIYGCSKASTTSMTESSYTPTMVYFFLVKVLQKRNHRLSILDIDIPNFTENSEQKQNQVKSLAIIPLWVFLFVVRGGNTVVPKPSVIEPEVSIMADEDCLCWVAMLYLQTARVDNALHLFDKVFQQQNLISTTKFLSQVTLVKIENEIHVVTFNQTFKVFVRKKRNWAWCKIFQFKITSYSKGGYVDMIRALMLKRKTRNNVRKISGIFLVGQIETDLIKPARVATFDPYSLLTKVKSVEMHHEALLKIVPVDFIRFKVKNVVIKYLKHGDVDSNSKEDPAKGAANFNFHVIIIYRPGQIGNEYAPVSLLKYAISTLTEHILPPEWESSVLYWMFLVTLFVTPSSNGHKEQIDLWLIQWKGRPYEEVTNDDVLTIGSQVLEANLEDKIFLKAGVMIRIEISWA